MKHLNYLIRIYHLFQSFYLSIYLSTSSFISFRTFWFHLLFIFLKVFVQNFIFQEKFFVQKLVLFIFFILFSLCQKNKGLTAWILLCLPSPLSKNSKRHNLRILLILPFTIYKSFQRTNRLRIILYPHSQSTKGLTAWDLCLNTLEGTSFVVQEEGTSTWVIVTENKRGYISCGSVLVEGTSTRLFKENKGGYIPCGSLLVKDFTRLKKNLKDRRSLGDWM